MVLKRIFSTITTESANITQQKEGLNTGQLAGAIVGPIVFIAALSLLAWWLWKDRLNSESNNTAPLVPSAPVMTQDVSEHRRELMADGGMHDVEEYVEDL